MPVTPAHPAAILPVYAAVRGHLRASALVVGSMVPDFAYLVRDGGYATHSLVSLFWFSLPVGLLTVLWWEALIRPALARPWPTVQRALPRSPSQWLGLPAGVLIGAATHLLWDGFVHSWMWPADVLYPDLSPDRFSFLHHLSSASGLTVLAFYLARRYHPGVLRTDEPKRVAAMFGFAAGGAAAGCIASSVLASSVLSSTWSAALGAAIGLTIFSLRPGARTAIAASERGAAGAGSVRAGAEPAARREG